MTTPAIKRERSPSPTEAPRAPESDVKKRAVEEEEAVPVAIPFPGLLAMQSGITTFANPPRILNIEDLLGLLQKEARLIVAHSSLTAQMAVSFFSTEAVSALLIFQTMPTICPAYVQSYFQWEEGAAQHVTQLWYDIDLDSATTMTHLESAFLRFLPLCKNLNVLKLKISGRFAEGELLMACIQRVLKRLPAKVNQIGLFIDMGHCSVEYPSEFAEIFDSLMLSLISRHQLCAVELDVSSSIDWSELLDSNDLSLMISQHPRPFQLTIIDRNYEYKKVSSLFRYKYVQGEEWEACAELYNEMVADLKQAQAPSLLIANKLFPKPAQSAPSMIGVTVDNQVLTQWNSWNTSEEIPCINHSLKQGVIWCDFDLTPPK
jgi:hypothetical protein